MIDAIERLMQAHFETLPFHNLSLIYGQPDRAPVPGGTCSDKTLAFLHDVHELDVDAHLHSAYIGGEEIHRLVRVIVDQRVFFADVGNGWPALKLFPADEGITFECFGMKYRSEIIGNWVRVLHQKQGKECLQMEIDVTPKNEAAILDQIKSRYTSGIEYPFSKSLRFSMIVGKEFRFLRGNRIERYSSDGYTVKQLNEQDIPRAISREFGFDMSAYLA